MEKLKSFFKGCLLWALAAVDVQGLEPIAAIEIPDTFSVAGLRVGGLSALHWREEEIVFLSDNRGQYGPSRLVKAKLHWDGKKLSLSNWENILLRGIPTAIEGRPTVIDPEGLLRFSNMDFLISVEADTNSKPRLPNRLIRVSPQGDWIEDIPLPDEIQPDPLGQQKKGTANNSGPEGLSLSPSGEAFWVAIERSLLQEKTARRVRFERYRKSEKGYVHEASFSYQMDLATGDGEDLFRGVSSILALSDDELLVLERSAFVSRARLSYGGGLYRTRCLNDQCEKKKLLDLSKDLNNFRKGKKVPNFEGLAWGPSVKDGKHSILLLSDNNFSEKTVTELILLKAKDTP